MQNLVILGTLWWIKTLLSILSTQPLGFLFFLRFMNYNKIKCVYHFVECFANDERLISDFYDHGVVQAYQANLRCTLFVFSSWVFAFSLPWLLVQTYRSFAASFWFTITQPKSLVKNSHDCRTKKQESYLTMTCIDDHWQHLSVFWNSSVEWKKDYFWLRYTLKRSFFLIKNLKSLLLSIARKLQVYAPNNSLYKLCCLNICRYFVCCFIALSRVESLEVRIGVFIIILIRAILGAWVGQHLVYFY